MIATLTVAFAKALAQLADPAMRRVVWRGVALAVGTFVALLMLAWWGLSGLSLIGLAWADTTLAALGFVAAVIVAIFLFPAGMIAAQSLLLDDVAAAVERKHYPASAATAPSLVAATAASLRLAGTAMLFNLLALPLYFVPFVNVFVFLALNGYLYSREYFELVALRRMNLAAARAMRKRHRRGLFVAGLFAASLFAIPVVGWFMPAPVAAMMVHVFEALRRRDELNGIAP